MRYVRNEDEITPFEKEWEWNTKIFLWGIFGIVLAPCIGILLCYLLS